MSSYIHSSYSFHSFLKEPHKICIEAAVENGYAVFEAESASSIQKGNFILKKSEDGKCKTLWRVVKILGTGGGSYTGKMEDMFRDGIGPQSGEFWQVLRKAELI